MAEIDRIRYAEIQEAYMRTADAFELMEQVRLLQKLLRQERLKTARLEAQWQEHVLGKAS